MKKILLVGCGHMGFALLNSWHKNKKLKINVVDPITYNALKRKKLNKVFFNRSIKNIKNINNFDIIVLAVKPQKVLEVMYDLKSITNKKILFLSIIAGKRISFFENFFKHPIQLIRAMPNMPVFVGKGITSLIDNKKTLLKNRKSAESLFSGVGEVIWLKKESDIDRVTAISGSGPGYFFLFIEYLISAGIKLNLDKKIVKKLVYQTAIGSIDLLSRERRNVTEMRKSIAIKGGTTEAAINTFAKNNRFKKIIEQAIKSAYDKSKLLGYK